MAGQYVCTLDEASAKKAEVELFEKASERLSAVQTLREWAVQQKWLKTPTDTRFLLMILRARKFSQLRARELLESYWTVRTELPTWYRCSDISDPKVLSILKKGIYCPLPQRDKDGQKILLGRFGALDPSGKSYTFEDWIQASNLMFDSISSDENTQVNGLVFLLDMTGYTLKHTTFIGMENSKKSVDIFQKAFPGRIKALHYYNVGPVFETMFKLIYPLMKEKLRSRITMHGQSMMSVYKHISMELLPEEYLPDDYTGPSAGPIKGIMENFIADLLTPEKRQYLQSTHSDQYGVDLKKKPRDAEQASFRKLNTD